MINKDSILNSRDFTLIPSPAYVLDSELLEYNMQVIDKVRKNTDAEIIVALKANAMWSIFPELKKHSDGATASSLAEAHLVFDKFGCKTHTYAPVYTDNEIDEILQYSSHITFNSLNQYRKYYSKAKEYGVSCGIRINPEYSTVKTDLYNPCNRGSRLGVLAEDLKELPEGIEGLHFHSLCESRPEDLEQTLQAVENRFSHFLDKVKWLNMGGGHLMTHKDYDEDLLITIINQFKDKHPNLRIILEPGSAFTWDTGCLVSTVEDIVKNGGINTIMLNVSFACHMPDCLEMPYKPTILGMHDPTEKEIHWRMGGNSCLAGDFMGDWAFDNEHEPKIGERIVFRDMIHYTMVKTTMFNGVTHPEIGIYNPEQGYHTVRKFGYSDFRDRMS